MKLSQVVCGWAVDLSRLVEMGGGMIWNFGGVSIRIDESSMAFFSGEDLKDNRHDALLDLFAIE